MAHSSGGRKGRAIVGLIGLAPQRYLSPGRIAEIVGCTPSRVSDALCALAESREPGERTTAEIYRRTAQTLGQNPDRPRKPLETHEYEPSDTYTLMHSDPACLACNEPKWSPRHG